MRNYIGIMLLSMVNALCFFLLFNNTVLASNEISTNPSIAEIQKKYFRISTVNEKQSMAKITGYSGEQLAKFQTEGYGKPCVNNVAGLMRAEAATVIFGSNKILAFLDCPSANDGGAESIVALFDSSNTDEPVCFSNIDLMDKDGYYYWGFVSSVEVRKLSNNDFVVVPILAGGDAGDSWKSHVILHMNSKCQLTVLSKFYAGMYRDTDNEGQCDGEKDSYKFLTDSTIQYQRVSVMCTKKGERTKPVFSRRIDLKLMMSNPILRIIEPQ